MVADFKAVTLRFALEVQTVQVGCIKRRIGKERGEGDDNVDYEIIMLMLRNNEELTRGDA